MNNLTLKILTPFIATLATILVSSHAVADTSSHQGDILQTGEVVPVTVLNFPSRGMSAGKVENELGRPIEVIPSVGLPPISRWVYNDRTVYFEYTSVIHVVAK